MRMTYHMATTPPPLAAVEMAPLFRPPPHTLRRRRQGLARIRDAPAQ
jgi:hypothetical protein